MTTTIYDKSNPIVVNNTKESHAEFIHAIEDNAKKLGMTTSDLTIKVGGGPAMTYRVKDVNENITLNTIQRFAAAVGKKAVIGFVPLP